MPDNVQFVADRHVVSTSTQKEHPKPERLADQSSGSYGDANIGSSWWHNMRRARNDISICANAINCNLYLHRIIAAIIVHCHDSSGARMNRWQL